jgi:hypothetical protein
MFGGEFCDAKIRLLSPRVDLLSPRVNRAKSCFPVANICSLQPEKMQVNEYTAALWYYGSGGVQ